jgi:hypothetical protein
MPRPIETAEELRERSRREEERPRSVRNVEGSRERMHGASHRLLRSVEALRHCDHRRRRAIARHPDVARGGMRTVTLAIFALFVPPAAIYIDWLLAGGTVDFLIQLSGLSGHLFGLKLFTLTMIVLLELKIAIGIAHALDMGRPGRRQAFLLAGFGMTIAAIMTFMTFVITAAIPDVRNLPGAAAQMPFATAAFTLTVHGLTLCTGYAMRIGLAWLSLHVQCGFIVAQRLMYRARAAQSRQAVGRNYRAHATAVEQHNITFPNASMMIFGPVETDLAAVLKTLFSEDELRRSGAIPTANPPQPAPPAAPPPPPPTASQTPPINQTPPDNGEPSAHNTSTNIDTDFSAMAAEEEAQRAEAEVTV